MSSPTCKRLKKPGRSDEGENLGLIDPDSLVSVVILPTKPSLRGAVTISFVLE